MSTLLEIKGMIKSIYIRFERYIVPVAKFLFALLVISKLGSFMSGYDTTGKLAMLDKGVVKMTIALIYAFTPATWFIFILMLSICGRLFTGVSMEAAIMVFCILMVIYLMFVRLFPKQAFLVMFVPILMSFRLIYVLPIFVGLIIGPAAIVPVGVGVIIYFLSAYLPGLVEIRAADITDMPVALIDMYRYFMNVVTGDKGMILMVAVFGVVIAVTYYVSRLEIDYIHYIAIAVGAFVNIFGFIIGNIILKADVGIGSVFFGTLFAGIIVAVMQFFRFTLDYQKAEKQQFEDDDYYYYVKAVPKIKIAKSQKEIKTIE